MKAGAIVGIGEAMVEFAPVADGHYAKGFAGDTLNTAWYLRRLVEGTRPVKYLTRVGDDALSQSLIAFLAAAGLDACAVSRDPERTLGLYLIELDGAERRFSYWRGQSAARRLADDPAALAATLEGAALIHLSGITLAILGEEGRRNLHAALAAARAAGAKVSFDPNLRRRLWLDDAAARDAMAEMFGACDVALPSFDDEASLWGDATPRASAERIAAFGVREIVVKNGHGPAHVRCDGVASECAAERVEARDTTGAGDAFNAGYLAGVLAGLAPLDACRFAHGLAGEVVRWPGALAPVEAMSKAVADLTALSRKRAAR